MGWNYRVMRGEDTDGSPWYAIHEVYYKKGGEVDTWTEGSVGALSETRDGLFPVLAMMVEAIDRPVLDYKTGAAVEDKRIFSDHLAALLEEAKNAGVVDFGEEASGMSTALRAARKYLSGDPNASELLAQINAALVGKAPANEG